MRKAISDSKNAAEGTTKLGGTGDLLTAGKLAAAWGVKPADVKKAIVAAGAKPDATRCGCAYYGKASAASIRKHLLCGA